MKVKLVNWLVLLLVFVQSCYGDRVSVKKKMEVKKHLNRLNKTPLKSIKSPDGDIIDCVHISHQPAFDHPLLQNHEIQLRPSYHPEGLMNEETMSEEGSEAIKQMWHLSGSCPQGTIPIRRTKKDDVLRASAVEKYGKKKNRNIPRPNSAQPDLTSPNGHQHAIAYVDDDKFYGAKAVMNVWEPKIQQSNEFSLSQIWVLSGSFDEDLNSIEAGWQVSPDLYGDNNTRLFTYWTSDAYEATGCYNLLCSGFIQINNQIAMGASIFPVSNYHGPQYDISILLWKVLKPDSSLSLEDPNEGNWWMQFGTNNQVIGYWPSFLFSNLADSATLIEWGGEVVNSQSDGEHTTTQMGSGHFPEEGFSKASYFKNLQIVDGTNHLRPAKDVKTFTEQSNCYDVQTGKNGDWGSFFYYGGPGRNPNCP